MEEMDRDEDRIECNRSMATSRHAHDQLSDVHLEVLGQTRKESDKLPRRRRLPRESTFDPSNNRSIVFFHHQPT